LVAFRDHGVLLIGPSGAGKSDLALRLTALSPDWVLVADDQVMLATQGEDVVGTAPPVLSGRIEVRGLGIMAVPVKAEVTIKTVVALVPRDQVLRVAEPMAHDLAGHAISLYRLHAFDASTPAKIALLVNKCSSTPPMR
jgi:serine kinase of HPr protein (carbohydrate metabolism regulator)